MAFDYDFRVLMETNSGSVFSYGTQSLVSLPQNNISKIVSATDMVSRINSMPSMSFFNGAFNTTGSVIFTPRAGNFKNTQLFPNPADLGTHYQFVSMSIKDHFESGSIIFHANSTPFQSETGEKEKDFIKRYKFWGNKVCQVLGVPENYWIYSDKFRLISTGSEVNYLSGDILAQSVNVKDNFAISNAGTFTSDIPFKHAQETDRWIKWVDTSGSVGSQIPKNRMLVGYSQADDKYGIKMPQNDSLILSGSVTASGIRVEGKLYIGDDEVGASGIVDNLGNHQASQDLFLNKFNINGVRSLKASGSFGLLFPNSGSAREVGVGGQPDPQDNKISHSIGYEQIDEPADNSRLKDVVIQAESGIGATNVYRGGNVRIIAGRGRNEALDGGVYIGRFRDSKGGNFTIPSNLLQVGGNISASGDIFASTGSFGEIRVRDITNDIDDEGTINPSFIKLSGSLNITRIFTSNISASGNILVDGDIKNQVGNRAIFSNQTGSFINSITSTAQGSLGVEFPGAVTTPVNLFNLTRTDAPVFAGLRVNGEISASGNITTDGDIIAKNYIVSSSVTHMTQSFSSGSTIFGDDSNDTHQFTGSILVSGSVDVEGDSFLFSGSSFEVKQSDVVFHQKTNFIISKSSDPRIRLETSNQKQGTARAFEQNNIIRKSQMDIFHEAVLIPSSSGLVSRISSNPPRNVKYTLFVRSGSFMQSSEMNVIISGSQDGGDAFEFPTDVFFTEYAQLNNGRNLLDFSVKAPTVNAGGTLLNDHSAGLLIASSSYVSPSGKSTVSCSIVIRKTETFLN